MGPEAPQKCSRRHSYCFDPNWKSHREEEDDEEEEEEEGAPPPIGMAGGTGGAFTPPFPFARFTAWSSMRGGLGNTFSSRQLAVGEFI
jgi:hypothetical protein